MVAYTGIQGQNILIVSSDPSNPTEGQIWYNSTSNLLKGYANVVTNAWASGGNLNTARYSLGPGGAGTQTAGLVFSGYQDGYLTASESYNGSAWTTNPNSMATARSSPGGAGTQTSALASSGAGEPGVTPTTGTEEWSGIVAQTKTVTVS